MRVSEQHEQQMASNTTTNPTVERAERYEETDTGRAKTNQPADPRTKPHRHSRRRILRVLPKHRHALPPEDLRHLRPTAHRRRQPPFRTLLAEARHRRPRGHRNARHRHAHRRPSRPRAAAAPVHRLCLRKHERRPLWRPRQHHILTAVVFGLHRRLLHRHPDHHPSPGHDRQHVARACARPRQPACNLLAHRLPQRGPAGDRLHLRHLLLVVPVVMRWRLGRGRERVC
ncbi:hypothetical protein BD309DRAFT_597247 [Dichomitus squalens]|nr:hypothetical protein BD309DRAFT_597247 [Dichomitus squalens]